MRSQIVVDFYRLRFLRHRIFTRFLPGALFLALHVCSHSPVQAQAGQTAQTPLPKLGQARAYAQGVRLYTVALPHNGATSKLLIFMPDKPITALRPCLFIAPAGTRLFHGSTLGDEGNPPEYLPYVGAGFTVVAYEIDGDLPSRKPGGVEIMQAASAFKNANAGVSNAQEAIRFALARIPNIDARHLYTAGHSSAGTLSLQVAEQDTRIAGCIAYAPCCDTEARLGPRLFRALDGIVPGFEAFMRRVSPLNNTAKLKCPVFLFHADDDSNVPLQDNAAFADKLRRTNGR